MKSTACTVLKIGFPLILAIALISVQMSAQSGQVIGYKVRVLSGTKDSPVKNAQVEVLDVQVSQERKKHSHAVAQWVSIEETSPPIVEQLNKVYKTDANGEVIIRPPAMWMGGYGASLLARKGDDRGYVTLSRRSNPKDPLIIRLKPTDTRKQRVKVLDEKGQQIPDVLVMAQTQSEMKTQSGETRLIWNGVASGTTGSKGEPAELVFNVESTRPVTIKPKDPVQIVAFLCGTQLKCDMASLADFGKKLITFTTPETCAIEFEVVDDRGKPIKELILGWGDVESEEGRKRHLKYKDRGFLPNGVAGKRFKIRKGRGVLTNIPRRRAVSVTIWKPGFRYYKSVSTVVHSPRRDGETAKKKIVLERNPYLRFQVQDPSGKPLRMGAVDVRFEDQTFLAGGTFITDKNGEMTVFLESLKPPANSDRILRLAFWNGYRKHYSRVEIKLNQALKRAENKLKPIKLVAPKIADLKPSEKPEGPFGFF